VPKPVLRGKKPKHEDKVRKAIEQPDPQEFKFTAPSGNFDAMISTGSTLLDLAVSGYRVKGGGIPSGIIMECFGPPGCGKTALLVEMIRSTQIRGGQAWVLDPEARMDASYMETYGVNIKAEGTNYSRPDTVEQIFDCIRTAIPKRKDVVNIVAPDSLAAFTTEMGMDGKDKRGQARAKAFSQGMTHVAREIPDKRLVIACSNQMRQGEYGDYATGGNAVKFYSSVRIRMKINKVIDKERQIKKTDPDDPDSISGTFSKSIGIVTECQVIKNSCDPPYRKAPIVITFGYGIDDIRANLQFNKDVTSATKYECTDGKSYVSMFDAVKYVEDKELEKQVRKRTIKLWYKIQKELEVERKPKIRM